MTNTSEMKDYWGGRPYGWVTMPAWIEELSEADRVRLIMCWCEAKRDPAAALAAIRTGDVDPNTRSTIGYHGLCSLAAQPSSIRRHLRRVIEHHTPSPHAPES